MLNKMIKLIIVLVLAQSATIMAMQNCRRPGLGNRPGMGQRPGTQNIVVQPVKQNIPVAAPVSNHTLSQELNLFDAQLAGVKPGIFGFARRSDCKDDLELILDNLNSIKKFNKVILKSKDSDKGIYKYINDGKSKDEFQKSLQDLINDMHLFDITQGYEKSKLIDTLIRSSVNVYEQYKALVLEFGNNITNNVDDKRRLHIESANQVTQAVENKPKEIADSADNFKTFFDSGKKKGKNKIKKIMVAVAKEQDNKIVNLKQEEDKKKQQLAEIVTLLQEVSFLSKSDIRYIINNYELGRIKPELIIDIFRTLEKENENFIKIVEAILKDESFKNTNKGELFKDFCHTLQDYIADRFDSLKSQKSKAKGPEWEISVAFWLYNELKKHPEFKDELLSMNHHIKIRNNNFSKEFDVISQYLWIECKNIFWEANIDAKTRKVKQKTLEQFIGQREIARSWGQNYRIISKRPIPIIWKEALNGEGIGFIARSTSNPSRAIKGNYDPDYDRDLKFSDAVDTDALYGQEYSSMFDR